MGLAEGILLLLPLHGVLLGRVLVHLPRVEAAPPDPLLVLAQLVLPAPLLGVDLADMELHLGLVSCGVCFFLVDW